ncbi:MAG: bifunctional DNA-formamidopyrimidine glycosylase/DNA-(apurinic or apyrimidinic site) lyase [Phycisphaerales bacterium]
MPELPEVESVRLSLIPHLVGRRVATARLYRNDICTTHDGCKPTGSLLLEGAKIAELRRHGKQLAILADDGRAVCVHLGMSGRLFVQRGGERPLHGHAEWRLGDLTLVFEDPRRFGGLWTIPDEAALAARWAELGPDALTITGTALEAGLADSKRAIKAALLDQAVLAGVGNIYADESLFLAEVPPRARANGVRGERAERLAAAIRAVLAGAIRSGGSTLRDYRNGLGEPGLAQREHRVYGRGGEPCATCGETLRQGTIAQRTTVWCVRCQRSASPRRRARGNARSGKPTAGVPFCIER